MARRRAATCASASTIKPICAPMLHSHSLLRPMVCLCLCVCVVCLRVYVWCCVGEQALVVLAALRYAHVSDETCFFGKKAKQICTAELIVLRGGIGIADGFQGVDFWPVERIATDAQTVVEAWVAVCKRERARVCNICI